MHVPPRGRPEPCYLTYPGAPTAGLHIGLPAERCSTSLFPTLKGKGCCPTAATGGNKALSHADRSFQLCAGERVVTAGRPRGDGGSEWGLEWGHRVGGAVTVVKGREGE